MADARTHPPRPAVSLVVPFFGGAAAARRLLSDLGRVALRDGDEIIVVDNTPDGTVAGVAEGSPVRVVAAPELASSYYARNVGAETAVNDWLLFVDADCRPPANLLDAYFSEPVPEDCGAVAGEVVGVAAQDSLASRYARSRHHLEQNNLWNHPYRPMAVTANLLVRRAAWASVGGFQEGVRSAGDSDFSWRLQDAGWSLAFRAAALVEHEHRESLRALLRQAARYGGGRAWVSRRHPGYPRPRLGRELARSAAGIVVWTATGRFERALFKAVDALWVGAEQAGSLLGNVSARRPGRREEAPATPVITLVVDAFPELSETFVAGEAHALARAGHAVRVEAGSRPWRPNWPAARGLEVHYVEDDGVLDKLAALAWLFLRHPLRSVGDAVLRRRFAATEQVRTLRALAPRARRTARAGGGHLHAHFATGAALDALRIGRLLGLPFSVTAHAYEIFQQPRNLEQKLAAAAFTTTGCDYNVRHLRSAARPADRERIHRIVMGVDTTWFRRTTPHPGGRTVVAIGRLVEKKGFADLVSAAARLRERDAVERIVIVGEGPLRGDLEARISALGVGDVVQLAGARTPAEIRELLERADLLAMPCVVAADGDRDSMPVVVKEALAMEVPVVASDEVGLPEVVRPEWGRLVPPGDPDALAAAIEEVLALPPSERAEMGRRGRAFVAREANVDTEARKLSELIGARGPTGVG